MVASTVFLDVSSSAIEIRLPSPPQIRADYRVEIKPGEMWHGHKFADLYELGSGQHELEILDNGGDG